MRLNYILLLQYLYDSSFWLHPLVLGYFLKQTNKRQTQTLPTCWAKLCIILFSSASVKWIVIHYLFSPLLWNVYLINPCNSLHDAFFFLRRQDYYLSVTHLIMQIVPTIKWFVFWTELIACLWKNPGKWILSDVTCPIPRSIMIKVKLFLVMEFSEENIYISLKSQFSHANLLFCVI